MIERDVRKREEAFFTAEGYKKQYKGMSLLMLIVLPIMSLVLILILKKRLGKPEDD